MTRREKKRRSDGGDDKKGVWRDERRYKEGIDGGRYKDIDSDRWRKKDKGGEETQKVVAQKYSCPLSDLLPYFP